ncbi:hypothetical protein BH20VER3_BH20VER3_13680 [soil metagenome]
MKKGCLIAVAVGFALIVTIVVLAFALTRGAAKSGADFLDLLGSGKMAAAYESASAALRSQQSLEAFSATVKNLGLTDYASASWSSRRRELDRTKLEGTVKTRAGGTIPLTMELVKESGGWKVLSLSAPPAGVKAESAEKSGKPLPSDKEARELILQSLLDFNEGVQSVNFTGFHARISRAWQAQVSADGFKEMFREFVEKKIDLAPIKQVEPILSEPPRIDSDGLLVLQGYYPTQPSRVHFKLKYIYEHPAWKLFGISVDVGEKPR